MTSICKPATRQIEVNDQRAEYGADHGTVLDALLHQGVEAEYHCKDGYCGACRCQLLSGEVSYTSTPIAFIQEGEILTCCCKPVTDIRIAN